MITSIVSTSWHYIAGNILPTIKILASINFWETRRKIQWSGGSNECQMWMVLHGYSDAFSVEDIQYNRIKLVSFLCWVVTIYSNFCEWWRRTTRQQSRKVGKSKQLLVELLEDVNTVPIMQFHTLSISVRVESWALPSFVWWFKRKYLLVSHADQTL